MVTITLPAVNIVPTVMQTPLGAMLAPSHVIREKRIAINPAHTDEFPQTARRLLAGGAQDL